MFEIYIKHMNSNTREDTSQNTELSNEEKEYEVQKILGKKRAKGKYHYLVKWVGFDETTWEPAGNLKNTRDLIKNYEDKLEQSKNKIKTISKGDDSSKSNDSKNFLKTKRKNSEEEIPDKVFTENEKKKKTNSKPKNNSKIVEDSSSGVEPPKKNKKKKEKKEKNVNGIKKAVNSDNDDNTKDKDKSLDEAKDTLNINETKNISASKDKEKVHDIEISPVSNINEMDIDEELSKNGW